MVKRCVQTAGVQSAGSAAAKVARTTQPPETVVEECPTISALLADADGLSDECRDMLRAMAPHCLASPRADRHAYENEMVELLASVSAGVVSKHLAAVEAIEAEIRETEANVETLNAQVPLTESEVRAKTEDRNAKDTAVEEARKAVAAAKVVVTEEQARVDSFAAEVSAMHDEKEKFDKLVSGVWSPLKTGISGREWRQRDKLTKVFLETMGGDALSTSFSQALPVALKAQAADRGSFAKMTVEHADAELSRKIRGLVDKIENSSQEAALRSHARERAEAALIGAEAQQGSALELLVTAENALIEAQTAERKAKDAVKALGPSAAERRERLELSKAALESVQTLAEQFSALRERPQPGVAHVPLVASPEEATLAMV